MDISTNLLDLAYPKINTTDYKYRFYPEDYDIMKVQKNTLCVKEVEAEWRKFCLGKMRQKWELLFQLEELNPEMTKLKKSLHELKKENQEKRARENYTNWWWITVSAQDSVPFLKFKKKVEKYVQRTMFKEPKYLVYEQRGITEEEVGKGTHIHFLCKRNLSVPPKDCRKNTNNTFKDFACPKSIHVTTVGDNWAKDKLEYIEGKNKTGDGKEDKQIMDVVFRKKNNLKVIYKYYAEEKFPSKETKPP